MTRNGWMYAWHTTGKASGRIDWPSYHHDLQNTGNFGTPLDEGTRASGGCGCDLGGALPNSAPLGVILGVALMLLLVQNRRRRRR